MRNNSKRTNRKQQQKIAYFLPYLLTYLLTYLLPRIITDLQQKATLSKCKDGSGYIFAIQVKSMRAAKNAREE
jgi:hypothetical protein